MPSQHPDPHRRTFEVARLHGGTPPAPQRFEPTPPFDWSAWLLGLIPGAFLGILAGSVSMLIILGGAQ